MSQVYPRRAYASIAEVHAGDVVRLLDGCSGIVTRRDDQREPAAFSDAIVVEINATKNEVTLARPHVWITAYGDVKTRCEHYSVSLPLLVERHHVLTRGLRGERDNRVHAVEPYFTVLIPWSDTPTRWHPTDKTGPFSVLSRGSFLTQGEANEWARDKLEGQPFELRYIDPMNDPGILASFEACTGSPIDLAARMRQAYGVPS